MVVVVAYLTLERWIVAAANKAIKLDPVLYATAMERMPIANSPQTTVTNRCVRCLDAEAVMAVFDCGHLALCSGPRTWRV